MCCNNLNLSTFVLFKNSVSQYSKSSPRGKPEKGVVLSFVPYCVSAAPMLVSVKFVWMSLLICALFFIVLWIVALFFCSLFPDTALFCLGVLWPVMHIGVVRSSAFLGYWFLFIFSWVLFGCRFLLSFAFVYSRCLFECGVCWTSSRSGRA